ncbi:16695_t:CDS:2, partial [Funneliformis geosporum]
SESASEICVAQQSKSTITFKVIINQNLFDKEHKKVTEAMDEEDLRISIYGKFSKVYEYTYASYAQFAS